MDAETIQSWSAAGTIAGAIATFMAVVVALFKKQLNELIFFRKIAVTWNRYEPCFATRSDGQDINDAYMRLRVENIGGQDVQNLEIVVEAVDQVGPEGTLTAAPAFIPTALRWTHRDHYLMKSVPKGAVRWLDFGNWSMVGIVGGVTGTTTRVNLSTEVADPNRYAPRLRCRDGVPTEYRLQIRGICKGGVVYDSRWVLRVVRLPHPANRPDEASSLRCEWSKTGRALKYS